MQRDVGCSSSNEQHIMGNLRNQKVYLYLLVETNSFGVLPWEEVSFFLFRFLLQEPPGVLWISIFLHVTAGINSCKHGRR
jgi:hypothetical protein